MGEITTEEMDRERNDAPLRRRRPPWPMDPAVLAAHRQLDAQIAEHDAMWDRLQRHVDWANELIGEALDEVSDRLDRPRLKRSRRTFWRST